MADIRTNYKVLDRSGALIPFRFDRIAEKISSCSRPVFARDGRVVARDIEVAGDLDPCEIVVRLLRDNSSTFRAGNVRTTDIDALVANYLVSLRQPKSVELAARLLVNNLQRSVPDSFSASVRHVRNAIPGRLSADFVSFVLAHANELDAMIDPAYDHRLSYAGLRTMINSYFIAVPHSGAVSSSYADSILRSQHGQALVETVQFCFMRLAASLGLYFLTAPAAALSEAYLSHCSLADSPLCWDDTPANRSKVALAFTKRLYLALARGLVTFGSPFFYNAGTEKARLASCFLLAAGDSLESIFSACTRAAIAMGGGGGIGINWGAVREAGSPIVTTGGESSGNAAWMRIVSSIRCAVNQGGRRSGAVANFFPFYHPDIVTILRLHRDSSEFSSTNQHTPQLKLGIVATSWLLNAYDNDLSFALVPPAEFPELEQIADPAAWQRRFAEIQAILLARGAPTLSARALYLEIFETTRQKGFPYMVWVDNINAQCNLARHARICAVNLCCEVVISTVAANDPLGRPAEDGVCVLGTVITSAHLVRPGPDDGSGPPPAAASLDHAELAASSGLLAAALDIAIGQIYFSDAMAAASRSLCLHRTVGIGQAGLVGAMHELGIAYDSREGVQFSASSSCAVYVGAAEVSSLLARLLGRYPSCSGAGGASHHPSLGLLQPDVSAELGFAPSDWESRLDPLLPGFSLPSRLALLRSSFKTFGVRNAYLTSTQPTASNSIIHNVTPGADVPNTLAGSLKTGAGSFYTFSPALYDAVARAGLDPAAVLEDVFLNEGSLDGLGLPASLSSVFRGAFEVDPFSVIAHAAARQPFCSQAQSTNLNLERLDIDTLVNLHKASASSGLNTLYYVYGSLGSALGLKRSKRSPAVPPSPAPSPDSETFTVVAPACSRDSDCEACQG